MPILVFIIVISFSFYLFYKTKYFRTKFPVEKKWLAAKASMALGSFVAFFGLNQFFINDSIVAYIVGGVFILVGGVNIWGGYKRYKHYLPFAIKEAEMNK